MDFNSVRILFMSTVLLSSNQSYILLFHDNKFYIIVNNDIKEVKDIDLDVFKENGITLSLSEISATVNFRSEINILERRGNYYLAEIKVKDINKKQESKKIMKPDIKILEKIDKNFTNLKLFRKLLYYKGVKFVKRILKQ